MWQSCDFNIGKTHKFITTQWGFTPGADENQNVAKAGGVVCLVCGSAGAGKTAIAHSIAYELGQPIKVSQSCDLLHYWYNKWIVIVVHIIQYTIQSHYSYTTYNAYTIDVILCFFVLIFIKETTAVRVLLRCVCHLPCCDYTYDHPCSSLSLPLPPPFSLPLSLSLPLPLLSLSPSSPPSPSSRKPTVPSSSHILSPPTQEPVKE